MTELATPPVQREQDVKRISHWIGGRLVEGFAQQLGGQLKRESGNTGTMVCLTLPWREASYDLRA